MIVMNLWYCYFKFFQLISAKFAAIKIPTTTNAGVVTALVTTSISGLKNNANKKQNQL